MHSHTLVHIFRPQCQIAEERPIINTILYMQNLTETSKAPILLIDLVNMQLHATKIPAGIQTQTNLGNEVPFLGSTTRKLLILSFQEVKVELNSGNYLLRHSLCNINLGFNYMTKTI